MADFLQNELHEGNVKVNQMYNLLKNPLANGYWSINEGGET